MKVALCFLISDSSGALYKEHIWREWIQENKDIINVYFHYKSYEDIKSLWILDHVLPKKYIMETDYFHVVPAYMSLLDYGLTSDKSNQWFCFLTESCVPIISPLKFRELFFTYWNTTFLKWEPFPPSVLVNTRANLHLFDKRAQLKHSPWFTIKRDDVIRCLTFRQVNRRIYNTICDGKVANESIFAIMLSAFKQLENVKNEDTHLSDWSRMMSATSPYLFKEGSKKDVSVIDTLLEKNKYAIFLRKVAPEFPDSILRNYIYKEDPLIKTRIARLFFLEWYHFFRYYWISHLFFCIGSCIVIRLLQL